MFTDLTIESAIAKLRKRKLSAIELVSYCLENINKYNDEYNVLLSIADKEVLLDQAREADKIGYLLPLSGIPIVHKDLFSTTNLQTTAGSKVLDSYRPAFDATVVRRLKEAGAIIIGKANEDAWGHGSSGANSDFGPTLNAYNKKHVAGGSSSGSAVAIALGMCLASTGTDTGGSIRVPAAYNNLVGLKPTYGRVSRYGIIAMASSLDSIGHITKTVVDSAILLSVTAGKDPYDATTLDAEVPDYLNSLGKKNLKGVKIGVSPEYINIGRQITPGMDKRLEQITESSLKRFESLGAKILEVSLPYTQPALETYYVIVPSEVSSNLSRYDGIRYGNDRTNFGDEAKRRITIGTYALSSGYYDAYYKTAQKVRTLVCEDFRKAFTKVDVIFAPVTPTPPPMIGSHEGNPLALYLSDIYTVPINLAGLAALSLPAGFVDDLPVGVQLIGPQLSENTLFQIGNSYLNEFKDGG